MKLILAIIHGRDKHKTGNALLQNGFTYTELGSTGGFLRQGNVTLLTGVEDEQIDQVLNILQKSSGVSESYVNVASGASSVMNMPVNAAAFLPHPVKVEAGGAVVFVLSVEQFQKF